MILFKFEGDLLWAIIPACIKGSIIAI